MTETAPPPRRRCCLAGVWCVCRRDVRGAQRERQQKRSTTARPRVMFSRHKTRDERSVSKLVTHFSEFSQWYLQWVVIFKSILFCFL